MEAEGVEVNGIFREKTILLPTWAIHWAWWSLKGMLRRVRSLWLVNTSLGCGSVSQSGRVWEWGRVHTSIFCWCNQTHWLKRHHQIIKDKYPQFSWLFIACFIIFIMYWVFKMRKYCLNCYLDRLFWFYTSYVVLPKLFKIFIFYPQIDLDYI